jgi:hypothetical protein
MHSTHALVDPDACGFNLHMLADVLSGLYAYAGFLVGVGARLALLRFCIRA